MAWLCDPLRQIHSEQIGGEHTIMLIDRIVRDIREFSDGDQVSFNLSKPRNRVHYVIRVYRGRKIKQVSLGTSSRKQAEAIELEVRARFHKIAVEGIVTVSTKDFFSDWLAMKEKELSINSWKKYRSVIDKALPVLPPELHRIQRSHIEQYKMLLTRNGYASKTIYEELSVLKAIFDHARMLSYITENPLEFVQKPSKQPRQPVEAYRKEELAAIFAELERRIETAENPRVKKSWSTYLEIFHCLNYTGMRISDVLNLKWENISLQFGTAHFKQIKTGKDTLITLPTPFVQRLRKLATKPHRLEDYVYLTITGKPVTDNSIDKAIRSVLTTCSFTKKSPIHSFRHTVAMRLMTSGMSANEVANQLGDTVETVVRTYVKPVMPSREAIDLAYGD